MSDKKDWVGNSNSIFTMNGARGNPEDRETRDFYATDPVAAEWLLKLEPQLNNIWEPFVGTGNLAEIYHKEGKLKAISDIEDRGYYPEGVLTSYGKDFLKMKKVWKGDIISNPPYKNVQNYVEHALELLSEGHYLALFMKITFLEGQSRRDLFKNQPPIRVWVSSARIACAKNNEFVTVSKDKNGDPKLDKDGNPITERISSAACYCWFVWQKGYKGDTVVKWFN